jgi:hypothetical protein
VRRTLAVILLGVLVFTAGCGALGSGEVDEDDLTEDVDHDWNRTANATFDLGKDSYRAIYHMGEMESVELYRPRDIESRDPVDPKGLSFRYPNGTIVDLTTANVERSDGATVVTPPVKNGSIGFAGERKNKRLVVPTNVDGSYEVILPENGWVRYPFLGQVAPGADERTVEDGRTHLRWEDPSGDQLAVEYYLVRDLLLLGGVVVLSGAVIIGGGAYFFIRIRRLRRRRDEIGLEVDTGDSDQP